MTIMRDDIRKRIEAVRRGEVPEGYVSENHQLRPCDWRYEKIGKYLVSYDEYSNATEQYELATSSRQGLMLQTDYYSDQRFDETAGGFHVVPEGYITYRHMSDDDIFKFNVNHLGASVLVSPEYPVFTTTDELHQGLLLEYLNDSAEFRAFCRAQKKGSTRTRMYFSRLGEFSMPIPPKAEQQRIAEILSACDRGIELKQKLMEELQQLKKTCLAKMFPQKGCTIPEIRFPGFTDPWEQRKLGDIGTTFTGLSGKSKEDFGHGDARFVTYMNVFTNPVSDPEKVEAVEIDKSQNAIQYGDVFFTTSSETPEEVGMSSVWLENTKNTYLNSFCFGYRPVDKIDPHYLAYMLRSDAVRKKIVYLAQGISRYNISKNKVMQIEVPLPELAEQKQLGEYFRQLDTLITLHQRELEEMQQKKKALMQLLLTGLVRVNV